MKPTTIPLLALVGGLTLGWLLPTTAQNLSLADRSYAYGAKLAQKLSTGNFEPTKDLYRLFYQKNQPFEPFEMAADDFMRGLKKSLMGEADQYETAKQVLSQYLGEKLEGTKHSQFDQVAFSLGVLALEKRAQEIKITADEFDWTALRLGYVHALEGQKTKLSQQQIEVGHDQCHALWEKRWQTKMIKKNLPTTKKKWRHLCQALGAQQATLLKGVIGYEPKPMDGENFMRGIKALATADLEALVYSKLVRAEAGQYNWEDPDLAYHMGRSALGTRPEILTVLTPVLDLEVLKQAFEAVLNDKKTQLDRKKRLELCSELQASLQQIERQLKERHQTQMEAEVFAEAWQYPQATDQRHQWMDPVERRSYALGVFAVQTMRRHGCPQSVMQYDAFVQGMQSSMELDPKTQEVLSQILLTHRFGHPTRMARDHGRFWLGHLLGYLSLGVTSEASDLAMPLFRQGFMDAKLGQPLLINEATLVVEVRQYQLLLMDRMENSKPLSAPFQQVIKDYSYALGFYKARYYKRQHLNIFHELDLDEVVRGVQAAIYGEAAFLQKEAIQKLYHHPKATLSTGETAYYLGTLVIGVRNHEGATLLREPLPKGVFDGANFRAGYQAGGKPFAKPRLTQTHMIGLEAAYKNHLKRRYAEYLYQQQAKQLQNQPDFFQINATKAGIFTMDNGLQYRMLRKGKDQSTPQPKDQVEVRYRCALLDGTIWKDNGVENTSIQLPLSQLPQPLQAAVSIMAPGAKYRFFFPYEPSIQLISAGALPIGTPLVYEIELQSVQSPPTE